MRIQRNPWLIIALAILVQACSLWTIPISRWLPGDATETPTATRRATATSTSTITPAPSATATSMSTDLREDEEPSLGPPDAPVTMIGFSDFACRFCRLFHQDTLPVLLELYPDELRYVYRDFPIVGGGAVGFEAAQAAECAGEQDAYWDYHEGLFSGEFALNLEGYGQIAGQLGLDSEALLQCLNDGDYSNEVMDDWEAGRVLGVSATPTFFINGVPVVGAQELAVFIEIIDEALNR